MNLLWFGRVRREAGSVGLSALRNLVLPARDSAPVLRAADPGVAPDDDPGGIERRLVAELYAGRASLVLTSAAGTLLLGSLVARQMEDRLTGGLVLLAAGCLAAHVPLTRLFLRRGVGPDAGAWERRWAALSGTASLLVGLMTARTVLGSPDVLGHFLACLLTLAGASMVLRNYVSPKVVAAQLVGYLGVPAAALLASGNSVYQLVGIGGFALAFSILQITVGLHRSAVAALRKDAELSRQNGWFQSALENMQQGLSMFDSERRLLVCNERYLEMFGFSREVVRPGATIREILDHSVAVGNHSPEAVESLYRAVEESFAGRAVNVRHQIGNRRTFASTHRPMAGGGWVATFTDITDELAAEAALRESEALNRSIVEASTDCVKLLDLEGRLLFMNRPGRCAMEIDDFEALRGRLWSTLWPDNGAAVEGALEEARNGGVGRFSAACPTFKGTFKWWDVVVSPVLGDDGRPIRLVGISRDMTQEKAAEDRVRWSATHDPLTELPNRALFNERLAEAIADAARTGGKVGLLHLDVDHLKAVNDAMGHDAGDALLKAFAQRLRGVVRGTDTVARWGGDEFAVILPGVGGRDLPAAVEAVQKRLREPFVHRGRMFDCCASIGASLFPSHGRTPDELLKSADVALYMAKAAGRGRLVVFGSEMRAELQRRSSMIAAAQDAMDENRVVPFYQPKVELGTGRVAGFEALLRWRHPRGGIHSPGMIAAAFEDAGISTALGDRMLYRTIRDMRRWLDRGVPFGHVALNAASPDFAREGFADRVLEALAAEGVPTPCFQLEVTESVFVGRGAERVTEALRVLSKAGVKIALDDFGTGYASLSHLKEAPVDVLKIDRTFVADLETDAGDAAIVRAILRLGHSLGIEIVAEGVETAGQARYLKRLRCDYAQGYFYSKAVPAARVPQLVGAPAPGPVAPASPARALVPCDA